jgi:hypothetical protein
LLLLGFIFVGLSALRAWTSPNLMTISHYQPSSGDLAPVFWRLLSTPAPASYSKPSKTSLLNPAF